MSVKCEKIRTSKMSCRKDQKTTKSETVRSPNAPVPSSVSFKSDHSKAQSIHFKDGTISQKSETQSRPNAPVPSSVSFKSDHSKAQSINFKDGTISQKSGTPRRPNAPVPSSVSFKSDHSKAQSIHFKDGTISQKRAPKQNSKIIHRNSVESIFKELQHKFITVLKNELNRFEKLLSADNPACSERGEEEAEEEDLHCVREGVLKITLYILKNMKQKDLAHTLQIKMASVYQQKLKSGLLNKYKRINEGISQHGTSTLLNQIYTELYITESWSGDINNEHEVRQIETVSRRPATEETPIKCNELFKDKSIRSVLTKGVAGIGKTVSVQKFILDWAEGKANQDIIFLFPLPFRELNLMKQENFTLMSLIHQFFPIIKDLQVIDSHAYKLLFIFDGLDECRLPLNFQNNERLSDVTESASMEVLLTNLIKGNLLPSALLWITTRPGAASQIPPECVDQVTEVRGFNDPQKEEYFRKSLSDQILANKIITHMKSSRSLYIMCHIPVFCWISATVLERMLGEAESGEIPKTLTQMFTHFLIFQIKHKEQKYSQKYDPDPQKIRDSILALGKLAFQQLDKGNLMFYEEDLRECGIDVSEVAVYSGVCTQIFRTESGLHLGKMFSFVHLSVQEFLAALYAFLCFIDKNQTNEQTTDLSGLFNTSEMSDFLKGAVDQALQSDSGHLDLFLRFLLGLSVESNKKLIRGLLTHTGSSSDCRKDIVKYIKLKFEQNPSPERSINLFYCLNELNDDSLVKEIQSYTNSGRLSEAELSPAQWSALVFVLLTSEEDLEVFDLQKFIRSDECFKRLLPVVQQATTVLLSECNLTERSCWALHTVLSSESSKLTEVDLSSNPLEDSGVKLLCAGLKSPNCKLEKLRLIKCGLMRESCISLAEVLSSQPSFLTELDLSENSLQNSGVMELSEGLKNPCCNLKILRLSDCSITEEGYTALADALKSSHLIELDLRGNDPGASGVKKLDDTQHYKLTTLRLLKSSAAQEACTWLNSAVGKNPLLLKELDLSRKKTGDSEVEKLSALMKDSHCKLQNINLSECNLTERSCWALHTVLSSESSKLTEVDLSSNPLKDSGVKLLCAGLKSPNCELEKLSLSDCSITEEGYTALAEALKSSHLIELDLRGNDPGASGVKLLTDLVQDQKLKTLRLLKSPDAVKACDSLTEVLGKNPLLQRELDLSGKIKGDSGVKQLSDLLKDPHCRPETLKLSDCSIREEGYTALSEALKSSHLIELDLRGNDPGASGVKLLTDLLQDPDCTLKTLRLLKSSAAQEACTWLNSVLTTNPLLLKELDLSRKEPGDSRVKQVSALLKDSHCKFQKIKLNKCNLTVESCSALVSALKLQSCSVRELDLSNNNLQDSGVTQLSAGLKHQHCKLEILRLNTCALTDGSSSALAEVLSSECCQLRELDLSNNSLHDSGVTQLSAGLKNPQSALTILKLCNCSIKAEGCAALATALGENPSHLLELDLSGNKVGDSGIKQISNLLQNPHCLLEKLRLMDSNIREEGCTALAEALKSSHLIKLDLRGNDPGASGVKLLINLLQDPHCKLKTLREDSDPEAFVKKLKSEKKITDVLYNIFKDLDNKMILFIKHELEILKKFLKKQNTKYYQDVRDDLWSVKEAALDMALYFLKLMEHNDLADALQDALIGVQQRALKSNLCKKFQHVCEGIANQGESNILNKIYTDLYITEGGVQQMNEQHEVRQIEKQKTSVKVEETQMEQEQQIECKNMFTPSPGEEKPIRTVVTQGVAGIGKSICVQKFVLDWAEGKEYQDIRFIFPLPFRELNLKEKEKCSLRDVISHFFPETKGMRFTDKYKVMFIFDGLDECPLPLTFHKNQKLTDVTEKASLDTIMTNLIEGNLLPSALIWITTRPAAAAKIPAEHVDRVTEVRGFNDVQKVEYFRKKISDESLANRIIGHIKGSRSLFIMCHIPVFCWISATVLERILGRSDSEDIPQTLTEMYTCFLIFQTVQGDKKYNRNNASDIPWDKEGILSLGKLAFSHLEKNNLIFYAEDLEACGIDPSNLAVYSGVCTQETGRFLGTVFSFVHLSIQEFIAALFTYVCVQNENKNVFDQSEESKETQVIDLLKITVDKALQSDSGHLDLFLRFLLGLSVESNQKLIRGLLTHTGSSSDCRKDIVKYIKLKFDQNPSPERLINLFYCLNELNDDSLVKEIQSYTNSGRLSEAELSPAQWSALVFVLLTSEEDLEVFDLQKFIRSDECFKRLLPVVQEATTVLLSECNLTERSCSALHTVLSSESSKLTEVDLSSNPLKDSGVKLLCAGLKSPNCILETLRLSDCSITEEGYTALAEALKSSHLIELDLRGNDPGASGVKLLTDLLQDPDCTLNTLNGTEQRPNSPVSRCVSFKGDQSKPLPLIFKGGRESQQRKNSFSARQLKQTPRTVKTTGRQFKERGHSHREAPVKNLILEKKITDFLYNIFNDLENKMIIFIRNELEMFKKLLRKKNPEYYGNVRDDLRSVKEAALDMALYFLKLMEHSDLADALQDALIGVQQRALKSNLRKKFQHVWEGIAKQGESNILNKIYTDLYITEGGVQQIKEQHEVRQIEKQKTSVKVEETQMEQEEQIECKNMFTPSPGEEKPIRTVVTQGVAGIGKSICVQKFVLDWAEGKDYQDIKFIFPLPFRELNLKEKEKCSLMDVIYQFFPETKGMRFTDRYKVMFIFDGLDECPLPLKFHENQKLTDVTEKASLDTIMTNLIAGNLLPSALIWITTRPAAAAKIPAEHVDRVTEVRGFNDVQKVEYFRKKISDESLANRIIGHIKGSRSLFIMCHIPVFCWISATVLEGILGRSDSEDIPQTLTEMYTCFLIFQTVQGDKKYNRNNASDIPWDKEGILSLGKLAFSHLEKNNLIFYAEDLEACGIDPSNIAVYSGVCTQETGRFLGTVFSFVHLSIQEFIAALFTYVCVRNENKNVFDQSEESKETQVIDLLKITVDKALQSDNGHLDLFLRFLLGLSVESNQKLIRGLLTHTGSSSDCRKDIVKYIKFKFDQNPSPERSINLFYCLNELNDDSLVKEIQSYMNSGRLSEAELSPAQWSALVFALLTSEEDLEVFDLQKFIRSDECFKRLLPVVQEATTVLLSECNLTERSCWALHTVLSSESFKLTEVDLSSNPLQDSGVKLICAGLKSPNCILENLRLSDCSITEEGYTALAEALKSSHLIELDLRGNDPGASGVKLLTDLLQDPDCTLNTLRLLKSSAAQEGCDLLSRVLGVNPLLQRELNVSEKISGDSQVKQLSALLEDSHCRPEILKVNNSRMTNEGCAALASALGLNPSHLRELELSGNKLGGSGMKLCGVLKNQQFKLLKLGLCNCSLTEYDCAAVVSALRTNPSHLKELDLSDNTIGDTGMKQISDLLKDSNCTLEKLKLNNCSLTQTQCGDLAKALESNSSSPLKELELRGNYRVSDWNIFRYFLENSDSKLIVRILSFEAEEVCASLTKVLGTNPLLQRELDLSGKISGDSGVKQLSVLLKDPHCRTEKLRLNKSSITHRGCTDLISALTSNPSHLTELDLSENTLGNSGGIQISTLLKNSSCKLQKLLLSDCNITEEGYTALVKPLKSNRSSLLTELDLRGNDPGASGLKELRNLINDEKCKLKTLRLLKSPDAQKASDHLTEVLGINPILQTDLNLSGKIKGDSGVEQLSVLLKDPHCRPETLQLSECNLTEKGCSALLTALRSEHSTLKELNLSKNRIQDSGVKLLSEELKNKLCKLDTLSLSDCSITEEGYTALAEALKSSHLIELDLRGNDPGASGVKLLTDLLQDPDCTLNTLRLLKSPDAEEAYTCLTKMFSKNPLLHTELDLINKTPEDVKVKQLSALLQDPHYRLQKLRLYKVDSMTDEDCSHVISALVLNPSHLRDLNLNRNKPGESGLRNLCDFLKNPECKLQTLKLCNSVRGKSCADLSSALCTNPSHIRELDLSRCELGDSGVEKLCDLLKKHECKLEKLLLWNSVRGKSCADLSSALCTNPSHIRELDLRECELGDSGVEKLCDLLKKHECKLEKLLLWKSVRGKSCADLSSALCTNPSHIRELDLSGCELGDSGVEKLCDLLKKHECKLEKLRLCNSVRGKSCADLSSALCTNPSHIRELDLSGCELGDSGVEKLCDLLKKHECKLEKLLLSDCSITEEGYTALAEALKSSHLIELDLRGNDPGASGVKLLTDLLQDPDCTLNTLRLLKSPDAEEAYTCLTKMFSKNPLLHTELDLNNKTPRDVKVKQLSALLQDPHYRLQKLRLYKGDSIADDCSRVISALVLNPSHLRDLNLNRTKPGESGLRNLCDFLKNPECKLQTLKLWRSVRGKSCADLSSALCTNPSHIRELDLSECELGDSGVEKLCDLLKKHECKLEKLLLCNSVRGKSCADLSSALCTNPSHIRELDLSRCELGDSGVEKLCDLLKKHECKLEKLQLCYSIRGKSCADLSSALCTNPSHIRELDLRWCELGDSGVEKLCDLLKKHECKLETLLLRYSVRGKSCTDLSSALCTNPSHIRELDLSHCELGDSGVEKLCDLLKKHECKLEKLLLWNSVRGKSCTDLSSALCTNPSHIRELDLSECELGDSGVEKLCDLLKKHECKLEKLLLINCRITDRGCAALTEALKLNSSHLKVLNLSLNKLKNSVRDLEEILKRSGGELIYY
ncbi:uncharacterized protein LOC131351815 [Hemibagrus wyckioides]|uniref:uncharacterized protein LOC131351815 n=1 Tax=Hemibagrus wyckioides TaxID=337641 RepID=UPI00266C782A|nr:uncharacterized protein LOC131351815 [Hemibagrus wyckioides]